MNTELFIAKKIIKGSGNEKKFSKPIINIAIIGIALGLAVMILAVTIVTGFKNEIKNKIIGFGSHIQIINYDSNTSYETIPIDKNQNFYPYKSNINGVKHIQIFATKAGIIKANSEIQGVVLKGIDKDFDWSFFSTNLIAGNKLKIEDSVKNNNIIISEKIANLLNLSIGSDVEMYFIQDPPRMRKFSVSGIYKTSLEEFDKIYVLADIKHIQKLNNWNENQISGFEIMLSDFNQLDACDEEITKIISNKFNSDGSLLTTQTITEKYPQLFDWLELQNMNVWIILLLMVFVAGFNMVSGILILILERTNMIGVLKSLGATNVSIRKIFLYNATYLTALGLFWGNIAGISLSLIQKYTGIIKLNPDTYYVDTVPINFDIVHLLLLNFGTLVITVAMLIIPSLIISWISPVKAIQFD